MQSTTQIQFGGLIINSDEDEAIIRHITRVIASTADTLEYLPQIFNLLFVLLPMLIEICHRTVTALDWIAGRPEAFLNWCGAVYLETCRVVDFLLPGRIVSGVTL